uniref:Uncharacterized protein n=1 Tax=Glossina palpalis gambiensis TaxID=67801 RepID=A0A1B0B2P5_9MUSC
MTLDYYQYSYPRERWLTFSSTPSSTIAFTHNEAMPIAASPAPANTNVESAKLRLVIRLDAYNPATATAAVP